MKYLMRMFAVVAVCALSVTATAEEGVMTESDALGKLAGVWQEDTERTLEQINNRLEEGELDRDTHAALHFHRVVAEGADVRLHFHEDGAARLEGMLGDREVDETGTVTVTGDNNTGFRVTLEGGELYLNRERELDFSEQGFSLCCDDGLRRHYLRYE